MEGKKTSRDIITAVIIVFLIGLYAFTSHFAVTRAMTAFGNTSIVNASVGPALIAGTNKAYSRLDLVLTFVAIGITIGIIAAGYFTAGNPLYSSIYFVFVVVACLVAPFLTQAWNSVTQNSVFIDTLAAFPITNLFMSNLIIWAIITGTLGMIAMYAKGQEGGL